MFITAHLQCHLDGKLTLLANNFGKCDPRNLYMICGSWWIWLRMKEQGTGKGSLTFNYIITSFFINRIILKGDSERKKKPINQISVSQA